MSSTSISSLATSSHSVCSSVGQVPRTPKRRRAHARNQSTSTTGSGGTPRLARPARPENSLPREVFETRFENPFKAISRGFGQKQEQATAAGSQSMHNVAVPARRQPRQEFSQRKSVNLRVMLSSLRLTFTPIRSDDDDSVSPGSSVSSQSTSTSTNSSSCSLESSTRECVRNGIRRTDPYGPPYYARAPVPVSGSRGGRSSTSSLSSVGISSLAVSEASSTSGVPGMMPPDAAHLPGTLSAAAAIADAARKGRLRDTMAVGCDSRP